MVWTCLKKLKTELPYDPAMPLLGIYLKTKTKTLIQKDTCTPRERQISYDITYMWNLKYDTNELIYKTETDS